jgi:hypothetical protein
VRESFRAPENHKNTRYFEADKIKWDEMEGHVPGEKREGCKILSENTE